MKGMKRGARPDTKKMGQLKLSTLNGLAPARFLAHDEAKDEPERASNDERVRQLTGDGVHTAGKCIV